MTDWLIGSSVDLLLHWLCLVTDWLIGSFIGWLVD
jgi:hypothetical protein